TTSGSFLTRDRRHVLETMLWRMLARRQAFARLSRHCDVVTRRALSFADDHLEHGRAVFGDASDFDHVDLLRGARLPRTSAESRFAERNDGGRRTAARSMSGSSLRAHLKGAEWSSNGCSDNRRSNPWVDREHGATLTKHHRLVHHRSLADENVLLAR